jgi:hypothetical protein
MTNKFCVWVIEIAILSAKLDRILHWEVWSAHNTRSEAVKERYKDVGKPGAIRVTKHWVQATTRIRKYIPV